MKRFRLLSVFAIVVAVVSFCSCSKDDDIVEPEHIYGRWYESYDDPNFVMCGSVSYTFMEGNKCEVLSYDALSGNEYTHSIKYRITADHRVMLDHDDDGTYEQSYNIVKLTSTEMAWQKEGTKFSKGTLGSDYKHFTK